MDSFRILTDKNKNTFEKYSFYTFEDSIAVDNNTTKIKPYLDQLDNEIATLEASSKNLETRLKTNTGEFQFYADDRYTFGYIKDGIKHPFGDTKDSYSYINIKKDTSVANRPFNIPETNNYKEKEFCVPADWNEYAVAGLKVQSILTYLPNKFTPFDYFKEAPNGKKTVNISNFNVTYYGQNATDIKLRIFTDTQPLNGNTYIGFEKTVKEVTITPTLLKTLSNGNSVYQYNINLGDITFDFPIYGTKQNTTSLTMEALPADKYAAAKVSNEKFTWIGKDGGIYKLSNYAIYGIQLTGDSTIINNLNILKGYNLNNLGEREIIPDCNPGTYCKNVRMIPAGMPNFNFVKQLVAAMNEALELDDFDELYPPSLVTWFNQAFSNAGFNHDLPNRITIKYNQNAVRRNGKKGLFATDTIYVETNTIFQWNVKSYNTTQTCNDVCYINNISIPDVRNDEIMKTVYETNSQSIDSTNQLVERPLGNNSIHFILNLYNKNLANILSSNKSLAQYFDGTYTFTVLEDNIGQLSLMMKYGTSSTFSKVAFTKLETRTNDTKQIHVLDYNTLITEV